jgi:DNA polymerase-3 subunit beta
VLVDALGTAGRAVSTRGSHPALTGIRAQLSGDDLTLTGSDLDLTITATIKVAGESDGVAVIPARLASEIVRAVQPGAVAFAAEDESLSIRAGRSEFSIRLIAGDEFPQLGQLDVEPVSLASAQLADALKQVVLAASSDDSRPILTGVLLEAVDGGLRLVATDSYRLSLRDVAGVSVLSEGQRVLIPSRALGELNRVLAHDDTVALRLGEREASFEVGSVRLITRLIEGVFPNYQGLIPESHPNLLTVNREELLDALRRVRLLARESTPIRIEMSDEGMELVAITQDVGTARESLESTYAGSNLVVAFNPQYLLEGAEVAPAEEITLATIDELKPAVIRAAGFDDFLYLIMPVRVS